MICPVCNLTVAVLIVNVRSGHKHCQQCATLGPGLVLTLDDVRFLYACGIDPEIAGIEKFVRPMPRMSRLIETGKIRRLTSEEKAELQALFLRVAVNDVRVLKSE
jgi:hypothetical protein